MSSIEETLKSIFDDQGMYSRHLVVTISDKKPDFFCLTISNMYEYIKITFDHLQQVSDFFGTKNINFLRTEEVYGCETCDYGSEYSITLEVKGATKNVIN